MSEEVETLDEFDRRLYEEAWTWRELVSVLGGGRDDRNLDCVCDKCEQPLSLVLVTNQPLLLLVCHRCKVYCNKFRLERGAAVSGAPS
jgi:hypothetical protein